MSRSVSPESNSAATPMTYKAGWDDSKQTNESVPAPKSKVVPSSPEFDDTSSESDTESPTPPPEPVDVFIDAVEENLDIPETNSTLAVREWSVDPAFCYGDSDIIVKVEKRRFHVHAFKLNEFVNIKTLVEAAQKDSEGHKTIELSGRADDFHNMLKVLYSSAYAPRAFNAATLKSTLRLSTAHNHPQLRTFSIRRLQKLDLSPIERFALSRDCNVGSWMSKALDDLCWREERITVEEAEILGTKRFVELAARREDLKYERGSRMKLLEGLQNPAPVVSVAAKQIPPVPTLWDAPTPPNDPSPASAPTSTVVSASTTASTSVTGPTPDQVSGASSLPSPPAVQTRYKVRLPSASPAPDIVPTPATSPAPTPAPTSTTASTSLAAPASTNTLASLPSNAVHIKPTGSDVPLSRLTPGIPPVSVSSGNFSFLTKNSSSTTAGGNTTTLPYAFGR